MSKGSKRRPTFVSMKTLDENWDLAFNKKEEKKECCKNGEVECKCRGTGTGDETSGGERLCSCSV